MSAARTGAVVGLLVGLGLSLYVGMLDRRKRREGARTCTEYRFSLVAVPLMLAGLGAVLGSAIAEL